MLGFVIGTVSLFALIVTLRRGPWGRGRRFNRLARRLHASPSQEEALRSVSDELFATGRATREDAFALIEKLRAAMVADTFDQTALDEALARFDAATARLRETIVAQTRSVHDTLDGAQRRKLVSMLRHRPWGRHYAH